MPRSLRIGHTCGARNNAEPVLSGCFYGLFSSSWLVDGVGCLMVFSGGERRKGMEK